ncbi:MAG: collagen-like protein [Verrucomicrobiaceae bacterium]|nr:collagen-like protein [Verrucomicrobiaceae bacterium]
MYDPTYPAQGIKLKSAEMRDQFHGLKDLIDALQSITSAQVDGVTTLNPGDSATVSVSVTGNTLHFLFGIPQGMTGAQGNPGQDGGTGPVGPQGPSFAQAVVDGVTTLNPGDNATVSVSFDGTNVRFTFGIPQGPQGTPGAAGQPGEVTQAMLDSALGLKAQHPSTVNTIMNDASANYDQTQQQELINKLNELINALK